MAEQPAVAHAMQVRQAVYTDDYAAFFRLYATAPGMGRALLDMFVAVVRWRALNTLVRAFKPAVGVDFVARLLGFSPRKGPPNGGGGAEPEEGKEEAVAALEVLPGCSAAVFPGRNQPEVTGVTVAVSVLFCGSQACLYAVLARSRLSHWTLRMRAACLL